MDVKVEWANQEEVMFKIAMLSDRERKRIFRTGVTEGAKVVRRWMNSTGPGKKHAYKSLRGTAEAGVALIGPRSDAWYYGLFDKGTSDYRVPEKKGRRVMRLNKTDKTLFATRVRGITAKPYIKLALEQHVDEVYRAVVDGYKKALAKMGVR